MTPQKFIKRGEKVHGPFSSEQIQSGLDSGKVKSTDLISECSTGPWHSVEKVRVGGTTGPEGVSESAGAAMPTDTTTFRGEFDFSSLPDASTFQPATAIEQHQATSSSPSSWSESVGEEQVDKPRFTRKEACSMLDDASKELEDRESDEIAERSGKKKELYIVGGLILAALAVLLPLSIWAGGNFGNMFFNNRQVLGTNSREAAARREVYSEGWQEIKEGLKNKSGEQVRDGVEKTKDSRK